MVEEGTGALLDFETERPISDAGVAAQVGWSGSSLIMESHSPSSDSPIKTNLNDFKRESRIRTLRIHSIVSFSHLLSPYFSAEHTHTHTHTHSHAHRSRSTVAPS